MSWIRVTPMENIPLREGRSVRIGEEEIAIFNVGDRFLAVDNACPHGGGPLCDGIVTGLEVACPLHGWKVSLETGNVNRPAVPVCSRTYETKVEDGVVLVDIPLRKREAAA